MEYLKDFIKPELLVLVPVLFLTGNAIKSAVSIANKFIPAILGGAGILLSVLWIFSQSTPAGTQEIASAFFAAITQGILCAGASVYVNELIAQAKKVE